MGKILAIGMAHRAGDLHHEGQTGSWAPGPGSLCQQLVYQ